MSLKIFVIVTIALPIMAAPNWEQDPHEVTSRGPYIYNRNGKYECKNTENCVFLYGNHKEWTCNIRGICEEVEEEHPECTPEMCSALDEPGITYACNPKGHCILIDFIPADNRTHHDERDPSRVFTQMTGDLEKTKYHFSVGPPPIRPH